MSDPTPVLRVTPGELPERVLVVGDPDRAAAVAERLEGARRVGAFREYHTYEGTHRGVPVAVSSHGVGAAGAAICFEELAQAGARTVIRAGTCGGLDPDVTDGDLVVATAAVREDGLTHHLLPPAYPAVASPEVTAALGRAVAGIERPVHRGVVLTHAAFYTHDVFGSSLAMWRQAGAIAVEMECAALFVIAGLRGFDAGSVLAVDGNPLRTEEEVYDPHRRVVRDAVEEMITVALDALVDGATA